jgi:hypothetical protein
MNKRANATLTVALPACYLLGIANLSGKTGIHDLQIFEHYPAVSNNIVRIL